MSRAFQLPGDAVILLGHNTDELGGSEYFCSTHGVVVAGAPRQVGAIPRIMDTPPDCWSLM